jgi:hypothetical protein
MADRKGDPALQPPECKSVFTPDPDRPKFGTWSKCPHIKCTYEGWESETYNCERCGEHYTLYEDEMK